MRKVRVCGDSDYFSVQLTELLNAITERNNFRGANKCAEIKKKIMISPDDSGLAYKSSG